MNQIISCLSAHVPAYQCLDQLQETTEPGFPLLEPPESNHYQVESMQSVPPITRILYKRHQLNPPAKANRCEQFHLILVTKFLQMKLALQHLRKTSSSLGLLMILQRRLVLFIIVSAELNLLLNFNVFIQKTELNDILQENLIYFASRVTLGQQLATWRFSNTSIKSQAICHKSSISHGSKKIPYSLRAIPLPCH